MAFETILAAEKGPVLWITLNRPEALNALNARVLDELLCAFAAYDSNPALRCLVLTGSDKAFAAGADIREMAGKTAAELFASDYLAGYEQLARTRKPVVAAVAGYALGGGCELAMLCDFILAADTARFGQPEIKLGITPGMGGSQRLTRAVGKAKAMEMCLTGRMIGAVEAESAGLVSRVVPAADLLSAAESVAQAIAALPPLAVLAVKEEVNAAFELPLAEGLRHERRLFHSLFATADQKEGMAAFLEKRPASWRGL